LHASAAFTIAFAIYFVICLKLSLRTFSLYIFFLLAATCCQQQAFAQYTVKGTVCDSSRYYTIEAVSVISSAGKTVVTDSLGRYKIEVGEKDSIWFSFLGRPTPKYPVLGIADIRQFDIALNITLLTRGNVLPEVTIRTRVYKEDSLQNRRDYAKVFNFRKPSFESLTSVNATGAGIDVQELIRSFQFRKNRSMERFRERLLEEEREKFIDHRFNKPLVRRLTGLDGNRLDQFMLRYRPGFEFTLNTSEYDFQFYIKKAGQEFLSGRSF
jgi:hypothetical protein